MQILVDTNILIHLEDHRIIGKKFSDFYRIAITNNCKIFYHPKAVSKDIDNDKNSERRNIIKSKLEKYESLVNPSSPTLNYLQQITNNKENDQIDNIQLFQVYREYVDFFVTEDLGIHKKAKKLGIANKVFNILQITDLLYDQFTIKIPTHPILKQQSIRELEDKFDSIFFDSLRDDYGVAAFNSWLKKCVIKDRQCYSLISDHELHALLIYNVEDIEDHKLPDIYCKALKICTLKVADSAFGIKLGELFINKMFQYCINQKIKYLYLTVYEKQIHLISLLETFGFYKQEFENSQNLVEIRMIKCLDKKQSVIIKNNIINHPFYVDDISVSKYAIPIRPDFYGTLFKDGQLRPATLFDESPDSMNEIQGNTIIKAYISNSKNRKLKKGDILFFYSSQTSKSIEPVGILETIQIIKNFDELWNIVSKKTVFSQKQLESWLDEKKELHVITFRLITYLKKKIQLSKINQLDSFKNKIQTITKISEEDYLELKNEGYFDQRYIIN